MRRSQKSSDVMASKILDLPSAEKLFRTKIEYGQLFLFSTKEFYCIFRPLTVAESEAIVGLNKKIHETTIEDWIFSTCYVIGSASLSHLLDHSKYKFVSLVANKIMILSNIQEEKDYKHAVHQEREKVNTVQSIVEILINKGYSAYSVNDIKNMTQLKQFQLLARAEVITKESLDLGDKKDRKAQLRAFTEGATVLGGDISSPEAADKPDFNNL
jgi:hypothetical protein